MQRCLECALRDLPPAALAQEFLHACDSRLLSPATFKPNLCSQPGYKVAAKRRTTSRWLRPYVTNFSYHDARRRALVLYSRSPVSDAVETDRRVNKDASLEEAVLTGNGSQALELLGDLQRLEPEYSPGPALSNRLLQLLARGKSFRKCWTAYSALKASDVGYTTLAKLMNAAIQAKEVFQALEVFRDMQARGYQPNMTTWCHLISSFSKSRKRGWPYAQAAYELWSELQLQGLETLKDVDASSYAVGMKACVSVGKLDEAELLLAEMQAAGHTPDIRAYNILLNGCAQIPDAERIPALLNGIAAAGLSPSATTYNTLVDAYINAGMNKEANGVFQEAKERGVGLNAWAYSSLMKGLVRSEMLEEAIQLMEEMEAVEVFPNVVTLTTLLNGCVRAGKMAQAEEVLQNMTQRRIPANVITYNTLLRGYAIAGDLRAVRDVLHRMGEAGVHPREDTFNTLMDGALKSNSPQLVPQLFAQLVNLDLRPDSTSYTALITALSRLSRPDSAVQAFGQLEADWGICAISLNALVAALANANRIMEAEDQLKRAVDLAADQGEPPPIEAYGAVLKAYGRIKDADSAMDLFKEFQDNGGEPDDRLVDDAVTACVRAKQFKRALQFVRAMESRGRNIDKVRLKTVLENVLRSESQARKSRAGLTAGHKGENLERLKFWLGFPNRYYGSDSEA